MRPPIKFGKYLLLERIAVGGMAEVFVAKAFGAEGFQRLLAIKKILPTMGEDPEFISMFVDEAKLAAKVQHQNVVASDDGQQWLVGCRFVERLDNRVYHWDLSRKRIVSNPAAVKAVAGR